MRTFIFMLFILCGTFVFGQEFEYSEYGQDFVKITAKGELFSIINKRQTENGGLNLDSDYWVSTILRKHRSYLTEEQLEILNKHNATWRAQLVITYKGDIESVTFFIRRDLLKSISEDIIRKLYNDYRNIKIDVSKACFYPPLDEKTYTSVRIVLR